MPYIQQSSPPPNKIMNFSLQNMVGGLNNRSNILEMNQCTDVLNMKFTNDAIMEKRKGAVLHVNDILSNEITFMDEYKPYTDPSELIRATDAQFFVGNALRRGLTGRMSGTNFNGLYFLADGSGLYVYGKFPQTGHTYQQIVGTPYDGAVVFQVVSPPLGYTPLDSTHVEGVTVYDYNQNHVWYEPCENEVTDPYKQSNVVTENPRFIAVKGGRLFLSGNQADDDNVYISDVGNPFYFPVSLPIQIPPTSDEITGLHVFEDAVVVGRKHDLHIIKGITNQPNLGFEVFQLQKLNAHAGFANHQAVSRGHNYLFFLGSDGNAYLLSNVANGERVVVTSILNQTVDFFKEPVGLSKEDLLDATAFFFEDEWYVSMKDKVLIYSYRNRAWTMFNNLHIRSFYNLEGRLIFGDAGGYTCTFGSEYLDKGLPYRAHWTSKQFDMDDANSQKQFREFFIVTHTFTNYTSDIYVKFEVDYVDIKDSFNLTSQISVWGKSIFGDRFITRNVNASNPFVIGRRGRNMRFTFSNGYIEGESVETEEALNAYERPSNQLMVKVTNQARYYLYENNAWRMLEHEDLNQPMRVYQVNGEYEYKGKR